MCENVCRNRNESALNWKKKTKLHRLCSMFIYIIISTIDVCVTVCRLSCCGSIGVTFMSISVNCSDADAHNWCLSFYRIHLFTFFFLYNFSLFIVVNRTMKHQKRSMVRKNDFQTLDFITFFIVACLVAKWNGSVKKAFKIDCFPIVVPHSDLHLFTTCFFCLFCFAPRQQ